MEWNKVLYIDCMNKEKGLPSLPDKSIDLCLTDFPFNLGMTAKYKFKMYEGSDRINKLKKHYDDKLPAEDYKKLCFSVFDQLKRICKGIIFTPGYKNRYLWFNREEEFEIVFWVNHYKRGATKMAQHNWFELILCWGEFNYRFGKSVFEYNHGFNMVFDYMDLIHPHPKPLKLYKWLIEGVKAESVIDPFIGSGTTAEVCKKLNIPWIGYEINEIYKKDIEKRLNGVNLKKSGLYHWLK